MRRIAEYGIYVDFEVLGTLGRCDVLACPYPAIAYNFYDFVTGRYFEESLCWSHFIKGSVPFSMEYEDADALCGVPRHHGRGNAAVKDRIILNSINQAWRSPGVQARGTSLPYFRRGIERGRASWKSRKEQAERHAEWEALFPDPNKNTHWLDPIYNAMGMENRTDDTVYTLCGEKINKTSLTAGDKLPSCEACQRIATRDRAIQTEYAKLKPRPALITPPKAKPVKADFEEILLDGLLDETAFENRKQWGKRSGRVWNDPDKGVQRDRRLRTERGGVNSGRYRNRGR
jgi:hypothetical protein